MESFSKHFDFNLRRDHQQISHERCGNLFKTRDFHHLKAVQLACEWYGGRERETVSSWQGRRLVRARRAMAPALRARQQLAGRGTAGRYTSQGFYPCGPSAPGPSQVRRRGGSKINPPPCCLVGPRWERLEVG